MEQTEYRPEGGLITTKENTQILSSEAALMRAMEEGRILEGIVTRCERDLTLHVSLGRSEGIIRREEIALTEGGSQVRDIAAITRVGKAVAVKILSAERGEGGMRFLLSRRAAQEQCRRCYLSHLRPGDIIPATVTHMEQFGAFVDLGCGVVSLLCIDCISVSRIAHPRQRLSVGQQLRVAVKRIDRESGRIWVTRRELLGSWEENAALFEIGQTAVGVVRSVEDYGVFVELTPNLAGLAEPRSDVAAGQTVSVYVKNIIPERMKVKPVIIDRCAAVPPAASSCLLSDEITHLDRWIYSPASCARLIGTDFSATESEMEG